MFKQMLKILLMLVVVCVASGAYYAQAASVTLPKTGQTKCYDAAGSEITPCTLPAASGQDANKLRGADWPVPRYIDNNNGTVTDNLTGLIWLKDANCAATIGGVAKTTTLTWRNAITWSNGLKGDNSACSLNDGSVANDWRLPNRKELESLVDAQNAYNAAIPGSSVLPTGHPFSNVQADNYWSSSCYVFGTSYAWVVGMSYGSVDDGNKSSIHYVWPVRGGHLGDSVISVSPAVKDFGALAASGSSSQTITINNSGAATSRLQINAMVLSGTNANQYSLNVGTCGSTTPIIAPGGSCTVSVTFTPTTGGEKRANLRISGSDVNTPNVDIPLSGYLQGTVLIPKTGQTLCYDTAGTVIACAGTGQDGDKQAGAAQTDALFTDGGTTITDKVYGMTWYKNAASNGATIKTNIVGVPATRFTDNGDGTQTDNLTGLVWLKDAKCVATVGGVTKTTTLTWGNALTWSNNLASGKCGLTDSSVAGDWRLPNVNELASLPTNYTVTPAAWLLGHGFNNVQADLYWSSSSNAPNTFGAWLVSMTNGYNVYGTFKSADVYVWPVRSGQSGSLGSLAISKTGTGAGNVTANSGTVTWNGSAGTASYPTGTSVILTAAATTGSFAGWTGCDSTDANQCTVAATGAKSVTATFTVSSTGTTYTWTATGGSNNTVYRTAPDGTIVSMGSFPAATLSYTDTSALSNTIYTYCVKADNNDPCLQSTAIRTPLYNGWNILGVPYNTTGISASTLFSNTVSAVYEWMPTGTKNDAGYNADISGYYITVGTLTPGKGYFVRAGNTSTMLINNGGTANGASINVTLKPGYTLISSTQPVSMTNIGTNWLIDGHPLGEAIAPAPLYTNFSESVIGGAVYWWNGTTYESWSVLGVNPTIEPWKAYWMLNTDTVDHVLTIQ